ncbi:hypothetical protein HWV62_12598 [Athelia sp. TMB]|nr:hypothetical protein HWV62_12598 [Athelia sp. TMB]
MSSQVHNPPRHRAYSAAGQPPPYSPPFFTQPPIATDAPSGRPRKHSASSSRTPRASASSSKLSRSAPATPPAYDEHASSLRRRRAASAEFGHNLFLTPANTNPKPRPPRFSSRSVPQFTLYAEPVGPLVQPQVHALYRPPAYGSYFFDVPGSGSDDEEEEDDSLIYPTYHNKTSPPPTVTAAAVSSMSKTAGSLRARFFGANANSAKEPKSISTTPGLLGAGETETEADEPPTHLPTSRIIASSDPLVPPHTLLHVLFEFSRFLSIVPAIFGTLYNIFHIFNPPANSGSAAGIDYFVSALWAILTGYQCLRLTTGLLARWKHYYPALPTLIRLLALQAICWPMTHATLQVLGHAQRPLVCWAVIGTFTCVSRSVQIWVTSNLWWETRRSEGASAATASPPPPVGSKLGANADAGESTDGGPVGRKDEQGARRRRHGNKYGSYNYWRRWSGGRWGGRRWDWAEVGVQCMFPAGMVYFVMAWAELLRRELERQC